MLVTDGVFSADPRDPTRAEFHPATNLDAATVKDVANQMRHRGLRWLARHGHLDATQDMKEWRHGGGWSVDASVHLPGWDRHGLERLARYCAHPALSAGRLGRLTDDLLVYRLRRLAIDGCTEVLISPLQLLARLVDRLAPPREHRHRYFGVLAPRARLRPVMTATAGPTGTVLQELAAASQAMGLDEGKRPASRSWAARGKRLHLHHCPPARRRKCRWASPRPPAPPPGTR